MVLGRILDVGRESRMGKNASEPKGKWVKPAHEGSTGKEKRSERYSSRKTAM